MMGIIIAIISGACMSVQGVFNTQVTKVSSVWVTNIVVQFSALLLCIAIWAATDRSQITAVWKVEPKYMLLGGAIGAIITYTVVQSMSALGPAKAVMIIVISQLLIAYLIELFGMFGVEKVGFEWKKAVGFLVAVIGIAIFKWGD
ncbi:MAG: DMT family transporter [Eubacteriales bacterium]